MAVSTLCRPDNLISCFEFRFLRKRWCVGLTQCTLTDSWRCQHAFLVLLSEELNCRVTTQRAIFARLKKSEKKTFSLPPSPLSVFWRGFGGKKPGTGSRWDASVLCLGLRSSQAVCHNKRTWQSVCLPSCLRRVLDSKQFTHGSSGWHREDLGKWVAGAG